MKVYLENVVLGGVILVTLEESFADREPLEEDSAGDYGGAGRDPLEEDSAGDDGGAGREPLDDGGRCLYKAGADGEALDKVGASVDKKAGIELRFLGSHLTSLAGTCREGDLSHDIIILLISHLGDLSHDIIILLISHLGVGCVGILKVLGRGLFLCSSIASQTLRCLDF